MQITMNRFTLLLALLLIGVSAATAQTPMRLSLDQAITVAIDHNRDLEVSRLEIQNADARVNEAFGNALPTVALNGRYTRNLQRQTFYLDQKGEVQAVTIGGYNAVSSDITVNQVLFNSAVFTGVGTAKTYSKISRQQLREQDLGHRA